jgi:hypothetical protein
MIMENRILRFSVFPLLSGALPRNTVFMAKFWQLEVVGPGQMVEAVQNGHA